MTPEEALLDAAATVAANLRAHDSYRGSRRGALAALKRRRPGFDDDRYRRALDAAIELFDTARRLVDEERAAPRPSAAGWGAWPQDVLVGPLAARCPGFPPSTYEWLVSWIDLYFHRM